MIFNYVVSDVYYETELILFTANWKAELGPVLFIEDFGTGCFQLGLDTLCFVIYNLYKLPGINCNNWTKFILHHACYLHKGLKICESFKLVIKIF